MSATILYLVPMTEMPNRLRELRKARGWTLERVALDADASIPTIADLEKGAIQLNVPWMRTLARIYGVAPADLLLPIDNPHALAGDEAALVARFRAGTQQQREQLLRMAEVLVPDSAPAMLPDSGETPAIAPARRAA